MLIKIIARLLIVSLAVLASATLVPGISVATFYTALVVAVILGLLNLLVRPILILLTLPLTLITFGLFTFIINALLLWFTATFIEGFSVNGFVPALLGSIVISIGSWIADKFVK